MIYPCYPSSKKNNKFFALFIASFIFFSGFVNLQSSQAANNIRLVYGLFKCSLSVESLKTYAETGEITPEFKPYTKFLSQEYLLQLRHWLQKDFDRDVVSVRDYTHSTEGKVLLKEIGNVVSTHSNRNGFYALRSALIETAATTNNWTIMDVIEQFPADNMEINTKELFQLKNFWQESNVVKK